MTEDIAKTVYSISQLNRKVRQLLETHLPLIWVEGEISNFACPASGHWYFSLKDDNAQVRCAMFRNRNNRVRLPSGNRPDNGLQVLLRCRVSLYEGRGEFQLIVEHMEEAGLGALQRRFEQLKHRLAAEKLFDDSHKQALPSIPSRIGVVTSPTGAAIHDVLQVLERRFPSIPITVYPTAVQGQEAIAGIAKAIELANRHNHCDVLIVGRGGGSMEDLWAFNEEAVARAIYASDIPIVSAVGHEVDTTIADLVADHRAATPSAAAELLSPNQQELSARVGNHKQRLYNAASSLIGTQQRQLQHLQKRLRHPGDKLRQQSQHIDHLEMRLQTAIGNQQHKHRSTLQRLSNALTQLHPQKTIDALKQRNQYLQQRLQAAATHTVNSCQQRLTNTAQLLNAVSPLNTLRRGYSITFNSKEGVVKSVAEVSTGETVVTRLQDGELHCTVDSVSDGSTP
ncbi:exodeoxyribonuclease VII large subunit [bacterium SCSIO 12696]|nr:exodeoxyribonuclease VII large subunit [bacterium SCSIO 12696]